MPLLFILILLRECALSKVNSQRIPLLEKLMPRLSFIFNQICLFYPELVAEVTSQIKSFLEMTIPVEIGWILLAVIVVVVGCAVALKKIKTSKKVCLYSGEIK